MELIEYKKEFSHLVFKMKKHRRITAYRKERYITDILDMLIMLESSMKADLNETCIEQYENDISFKLNLISICRSALKDCIKIIEVAKSEVTHVIAICIPIVTPCLEILEDYTTDNATAQRRNASRNIIHNKILSIIAKETSEDSISDKYNIIEKLIDILEYVDRDLNIEEDIHQSHIFIRNLTNLKYQLEAAIDFFMKANSTSVDIKKYKARAYEILMNLDSIVGRSINISIK